MTNKPLSKILIIDDDIDILTITKYSLENMPGVIIKICNSGEEGIKEALTFQPDLILLDVMMPQMDGMATLQVFRLLPSLAKTPIFFMTAKIQQTEIERYKQLGVQGIVMKPFDPMTLPQTLMSYWNDI